MNIIQLKKLFLKHSFKLILIGLVVLLIFVICKNGFREHQAHAGLPKMVDKPHGNNAFTRYDINFIDISGPTKTISVIWPSGKDKTFNKKFAGKSSKGSLQFIQAHQNSTFIQCYNTKKAPSHWGMADGVKSTLKIAWPAMGDGYASLAGTDQDRGSGTRWQIPPDLTKLLEIVPPDNWRGARAGKHNVRKMGEAGRTLWKMPSAGPNHYKQYYDKISNKNDNVWGRKRGSSDVQDYINSMNDARIKCSSAVVSRQHTRGNVNIGGMNYPEAICSNTKGYSNSRVLTGKWSWMRSARPSTDARYRFGHTLSGMFLNIWMTGICTDWTPNWYAKGGGCSNSANIHLSHAEQGCQSLWASAPKSAVAAKQQYWEDARIKYMNEINTGIFLSGMASVYINPSCGSKSIDLGAHDKIPKNYADILLFPIGTTKPAAPTPTHKIFSQDKMKIILIHTYDGGRSPKGRLHVYKYEGANLVSLISGSHNSTHASDILNIYYDKSNQKVYFITKAIKINFRRLPWSRAEGGHDNTAEEFVAQGRLPDFISISPTGEAQCPGIYGIRLSDGRGIEILIGKLNVRHAVVFTKIMPSTKKKALLLGFHQIKFFHVYTAKSKIKNIYIIADKSSGGTPNYVKIECNGLSNDYSCNKCKRGSTNSKTIHSINNIISNTIRTSSKLYSDLRNKKIVDVHLEKDHNKLKLLFA